MNNKNKQSCNFYVYKHCSLVIIYIFISETATTIFNVVL